MTTEQKYLSSANYLLERIVTSTSPFHTVLTAGEDLDAAGFVSLDFNRDWELEYGGKYYVTVYDSTLIAFTVGDSMADEGNLRLAMAHTDFPCFKLKPSPEMKQNGECGSLRWYAELFLAGQTSLDCRKGGIKG